MSLRLGQEDALQRSCVEWFRLQHKNFMLLAVPNGGGRSAVQGIILKMTGVLPGVFDLFLMVPKGAFHGLWLEAKVKYASGKKNYMSPAQQEFQRYAEAHGYKAVVFYTFEEFQKQVNDYLAIKDAK